MIIMARGIDNQSRDAVQKFYSTRQWRRCRDEYRKQKIFCERCLSSGIQTIGTQVHHKKRLTAYNLANPAVSLSFDNLELLCDECHEKEHGKHKRRTDEWGHVDLPPLSK